MDEKLETAILKTLAYSDIFDYPLRISELYRYLIGLRIDDPSTFSSLFDADGCGLQRGKTRIRERNGFFFLQGREKIVALRQQREKIADEKMQRAKKVLHILESVPFIKMVAVTGAVAAGNAEKDSDIDVLIVTQKNRLWLARLLAILLMELKGARRRPGSTSLKKDKFCLNMFISEDTLELLNKDLFTANEFARMKVVWDKDQTYERFIKANELVKRFLPNWTAHRAKIPNSKSQAPNKHQIQSTIRQLADQISTKFKAPSSKFFDILNLALNCVEKCVRSVQKQYMKKRMTTEIVTNSLLMFHPNDAREWVMTEYRERLRELSFVNPDGTSGHEAGIRE